MSRPGTGAVVHVVDSLAPATGGPAACVPALVAHLRDAGTPGVIIAREGPGPAHAGNRTRVLGRAGWGGRRIARDVTAAAREHDAVLVHVHGLWRASNHGAVVAARRLGLPWIVTPHGMLEPWARQRHRRRKALALWAYQRRNLEGAACLHATAGAEADALARLGLGVPIAVVANGIDATGPARVPRLAAPGRERVALFLSRVHPKKGLLLLLAAWDQVRPAGWRVEIVGPDEGGHAGAVQAAIRARGLEGSWRLLGPVDAAGRQAAFGRADLFVLPSHSENFGLVVGEALAAGLPVLTTTATPWQDLPARDAGWCVADEVAPLAAALREAVGLDDARRTAMGAAGAAWVREAFAWPALAVRMQATYAWCLEPGTVRPAWIRPRA